MVKEQEKVHQAIAEWELQEKHKRNSLAFEAYRAGWEACRMGDAFDLGWQSVKRHVEQDFFALGTTVG